MTWEQGIALALIAAGVWAAWLRVKRRRAGQAMAGWTAVEGTVLSHDLEENVTTDSSNDREWHYDPKIRYAYEVAGHRYESERVSLDGVSCRSRNEAQAWLDARPVGGKVAVHVNPANPEDALLDIAAKNDWWVPVFFIILGLAVAFGLFGG